MSKQFNPQAIADLLTPAQYIHLLNIAYGEIPTDIKNMSDDELLAELTA